MSYNQFTIDSVGNALGVSIKDRTNLFRDISPIAYSDFLKQALQDYSPIALAIGTEKSRSEFIIAPILFELKRQFTEQISLFSGREFNVDAAEGLTGYCDFLISQSPEQLFIQAPVVTVVEAKNDNIKSGFGQCVAEMVAAQRFNQRQENVIPAVYGVITTGSIWQFLRLQSTTVDIDLTEYFLNDVGKILGILKHCVAG
ncbi:hypothetical protein [Leptothoe spongobia]|uniref:Uncharacterized protein n=1 Tax=Leptothoe spongobia TAU-MAC 1115 TaxID=1967444 RepID=A0A947DHT5_9CYAN|nr:hypothetical protein [Leptothoe spongobia]MBT9317177.1 hypothetical protein [Leptothoe spongobia TAU-MAC 1115]